MEQNIINRIETNPDIGAFIRRAGVMIAGIEDDPDFEAEFPTLDLVARTLGYSECPEGMRELWTDGGWIVATDNPERPNTEDRAAVCDIAWELVRNETQRQRWAADLVLELQASDEEDCGDLDEAILEAGKSEARVRQGRALLIHLGDSRAERLVPFG